MAAHTYYSHSFRPGPVTALAENFTTSADQLACSAGDFATRAYRVDDAWGAIPESAEVLSQYREVTQRTTVVLEGVVAGLRHYAVGLHHAVASYEAAETARAQQFGGK
ncbi:ESX-1 secretion-associated protein [Streptomyces sp. NPDC001793]|uniref:ESX-1 secretion-associated protein n=1 Tax=Streptomyces sp. NPDC001793 TaxID=3154657 RepID=UPI00331C66FF